MGLIPADKIAELRDRTDIVQVISAYVSLRRAGANNWKGLCPFHEEKTPSFNVHAGRQLFHCFGCGASGDAIRFLMDHEKRDFLDVVRDLAQRAGMNLPETTSREQVKQASERERLLEINQAACRYFERMLKAPDAESARARAYLESRGIGAEITEKFRIGYAPGGWDHLQTFLLKEGLPVSRAEQLGLVGISAQGRRYDFFRDRIILPVLGRSGEVVAFGSRLMDPEAKERKYVNSPDSPVYHKKDHLYGLHAAREAIRKRGRALLVEGNFDVLALHQAGIEEAVAPMGTALTPDQISLLHRFAPTLVIAFDGDGAGRKATAGAVELLAKMGVPGRVVALPDGSDPDDFIRNQGQNQGAERFEGMINHAQSSIEFYLDQLINQAEATVDGRLAVLERAKPLLLSLPDPVARDMYTKYVSMKLGMDSALVQRTLRGAPMPKQRETIRPQFSKENPTSAPVPTRQQMDEARLVAILLACPDLSSQALTVRAELRFHDDDMARLLDHVLDLITKQGNPNPADVLEEAPAEAKRTLSAALMEDVASERAFHECIKRLRKRHWDEELDALRKAYATAPTPELLAKVTAAALRRPSSSEDSKRRE